LKLKQQVGSLTLIPSSGGVFEITVNDVTVYSKKATGQFPDPEAILQEVRKLR